MGNMSLWGVWSSDVDADTTRNGVYTYGRKNKEQLITMNLEYALDVDEIGAVIQTEGLTLISYKDGSDFGVKAIDPDTKATGTYESLEFRVPIKKPEGITEWKYAEIFMEPLLTGCSVEFYYKTNHATNWTQAYTADGNLSFSSTNGKKAVFRIGAEGDVFESRIVLVPFQNTTPEIFRLRVYFS